ncbi:hypothetical protein ARMGADRAFT_795706 [Armillaria gallica]|uniref:Uncharacterized protein n=1 Tax=Armillaria gallica TaxID=47427 RepID=A0A2H3DJB7_ARMGA|nr:hypothetical protein ARMGADRAFT_795706 [Armillaria gallica]
MRLERIFDRFPTMHFHVSGWILSPTSCYSLEKGKHECGLLGIDPMPVCGPHTYFVTLGMTGFFAWLSSESSCEKSTGTRLTMPLSGSICVASIHMRTRILVAEGLLDIERHGNSNTESQLIEMYPHSPNVGRQRYRPVGLLYFFPVAHKCHAAPLRFVFQSLSSDKSLHGTLANCDIRIPRGCSLCIKLNGWVRT